MRHIRNRKDNNKQGALLVTIIFILAIAMIFISSALLLTKATRGRIYTRAEDNQARLTVTAAAESFYQALYLQEITDATLQSMDGAVLEITNPNMPGMMSGVTMGKDASGEYIPGAGQTIAIFDVSAQSATINFKTNIGGQIECIQMSLMLNNPGRGKNNFPNVVEIGNGGSINNLTVGNIAGQEARYNSEKNIIAVHGDQATTSRGNTKIYSTYVTSGHTGIRDISFYGDVIFWGQDAGVQVNASLSMGTPINMQSSDRAVFFIDNLSSFYNNNSALSATNTDNVRQDVFGGNTSLVLKNVTTTYFTSEQMLGGVNRIYATNSALSIPDVNQNRQTLANKSADPITSELSARLALYADTNYAQGGDSPTDYIWSSINSSTGASGKLTDHRTGAVNLSTQLVGSGAVNLAPGSYLLNGSLNRIVHLDLSAGDYFFFISNSFTFSGGGAFVALNGTADSYACYIIIENGAYLSFAGGDQAHGLISGNVYNGVTFDGTMDELNACKDRSKLNQNISPYIYVYGAGTGSNTGLHTGGSDCDSGQVRFERDNRGGIMTAYVGLYPTSYDSSTNTYSSDAGAISFASGANVTIYGRLSASYIVAMNGSNTQIPYCPEPNTDGLSDRPIPVYTDYRIFDYQYYTV